jgi:ribosomal protein L18
MLMENASNPTNGINFYTDGYGRGQRLGVHLSSSHVYVQFLDFKVAKSAHAFSALCTSLF